MAKKNEEAKVTRISASNATRTPGKKTNETTSAATKSKRKLVKKDLAEKKRGPIASFFGYFKGAWKELKEVRWPTRSATWSLTGAVLLFSAFFVVLILLIDALFKYIFELILA